MEQPKAANNFYTLALLDFSATTGKRDFRKAFSPGIPRSPAETKFKSENSFGYYTCGVFLAMILGGKPANPKTKLVTGCAGGL